MENVVVHVIRQGYQGNNLLKGHCGGGSQGRDGGKVGHRPHAVARVGVQLSPISRFHTAHCWAASPLTCNMRA